MTYLRHYAAILACVLLQAAAAAAQIPGATGDQDELPAFEGPSPPVAPAVISRNAEGRATIRAVRVSEPLRIDGVLDEALYEQVPGMSGFIQIEPVQGQPATEKTEVWLAFDDDNVYVSFRNWDSQMDRLIASELRRDNGNIWSGGDVVGFNFDTFFDRRNSIFFSVNPISGRQDGQITNERQYQGDWNPVWETKAGRFEGGWTVEAAIPFKSIKFRPGRAQLWGFNAVRIKRSKNEIAFMTRMPNSRGQNAIHQISLGAVVVGMEVPPDSRAIDLKPYVTSSVTTDRTARPQVLNDVGGDIGLDARVGVSENLVSDLTFNTDFAQVEADEQQINLTRFSLFFPEKREFFLESAGIFSFGGVPVSAANSDAPIMFYSRRIGLSRGREVPLQAGGRLTGRVGRFSIGAVNIQTGDEPAAAAPSTNFTILRLRRDLLRSSAIGVIASHRSVVEGGTGSNTAFGVDGEWRAFENVLFYSYWARTQTDGVEGDDTSYRAHFDYPGDRYGLQAEHLAIGDNFNPQVGFVRRDNMVRDFAQLRFSPRPRADRASTRRIRRFFYQGSLEHITDRDGRLESRERLGEFALEFVNADRLSVTYTNLFEFLPVPFAIFPNVRLPIGGYSFNNTRVAFTMGQQHRFGFNVALDRGSFYNGDKTTLSVSRGRMVFTPKLSVEPTYTNNRVDLVQGSFTTHLSGTRIIYTATPLMFASAFVQYNSGTNSVSANVRLRWEYRPGSELFIVYNDQRDTLVPGFPELTNRAFIIKVNRLFRY